jgi:BirA family biotin operon repressor/biotin-[acetyl-CoA-carboxylase] ligase
MPRRPIPSSTVPDVDSTVHRYASLDSTQDEARRLLEAGRARVGDVILADEQNAGRGRFGRTWLSPRGGLYATFLLEAMSIPSLRAGLAIARALEAFGLSACLKWPNDVLLDGRKVAGVLIERVGDRLLVGCGVNLESAPVPTSTSVRSRAVDVDREALLSSLRGRLRKHCSTEKVLDAYRTRCDTLSRVVCILRPEGGAVEGRAVDVDGEGRLLVEGPDGLLALASGECEHVDRPVDGEARED